MGQRTLLKVWDGSGNPTGGPGRVGGPSRRSGKGHGTIPKVRDGLQDLCGGLGWIGVHYRWSWDGSGDPPVGLGWVRGPSTRFGTVPEPSKRSRTGRGTLSKVWDGSGDPPEHLG